MRIVMFILLVCILPIKHSLGQSLEANGALLIGTNITLGNQNVLFNFSIKGIGTLNYGDASLEAGGTIYLNQIFKRHTLTTKGLGGGYELFALGGVGKNDNLLGASIFQNTNSLLFDNGGSGGFKGLGFGFQRELLTKDLSSFNSRRGSVILRYSESDYSIQLAFRNDLKLGNVFNGQATDYGSTGSLYISYSTITSQQSAYLVGIGLDLFTPKPDFSKTPTNSLNSDDGRKNVWFVLPPHKKLFYTNLFGFGAYQDQYYSIGGSLGVNSQKLGAYIQNTLHDNFGLNPRFPWDVTAKDRLFYEVRATGSIQLD